MSAARAYLKPARARKNLAIRTGSHVTRVLFDGRHATGVVVEQGGGSTTVRARREVILAAGSIHSPMVLQHSGIGPGDVIRAHGGRLVHHLPAVGQNLQDHVSINYLYRSHVPTLNGELRPWSGKLKAGLQYIVRRSGPLSLSLNQAGGFFRTRSDMPRPNMQLYLQPLSYKTAPTGQRPLMSPDPFPGFVLSVAPTRPRSAGNLQIRSADPHAPPIIQPNTFSHPDDIEEMLDGVRFLRKLAAAPSLAEIIAEEIEPGPSVASRAELIEDIRLRTSTVFHPSCTCRMGPDPLTNVVDARLKVHGLEGLRIADASVFPNLTSGNTNAPVIMLAEKAADLILADANR
jgi:choline dehydrogenase